MKNEYTKQLNDWFEIDEKEYMWYILKGYDIYADDIHVIWRLNDVRHREDGPASIYSGGYRAWWLYGKRHREDGAAVITADGSRRWFLYDIPYDTEAEFNEAVNQLISVDNH